ncbi:MAG: pilus assembly protein TadG-related protein [Motilibacteraceae bacterium]
MSRGRRRWSPGRWREDDGQLTVLIIGFTAILLALVAVVTDASRVFLVQRALSSLADGAAVAAAGGADEEQLYAQGPPEADGAAVPLDPAAVQDALASYLADADAAARFPQLQDAAAATDGRTATVTLAARVDLPFTGLFPGLADGWPVTVSASAVSPLAP